MKNDPEEKDRGEVLTKREYFAAAALQGLIAKRGYNDKLAQTSLAVILADALIAELEKEK